MGKTWRFAGSPADARRRKRAPPGETRITFSLAVSLERGVVRQHAVVESAEGGIRLDDGGGGAELRVEVIERCAFDSVGGADGGAEGGGIGDGDGFDIRLEDVGEDLAEGGALGCAAGHADALEVAAALPCGMTAHGDGLGFEEAADLLGLGCRGGVEVADDAGRDGGRIFGLVVGEHQAAAVAGLGLGAGGDVEELPVDAEVVAEMFAGEGAVGEADEAHEAAGGVAEHVAASVGIGHEVLHGGEEGVAGAEADDGGADGAAADADQAARIVAGPDHDRDARGHAVFREVGGELARDGLRGLHGGELGHEVGRGGRGDLGIPFEGVKVQQVHARAVAEVDRAVMAAEHGAEERAHEVHGLRLRPGFRLVRRELADLRTGEAFDRRAACVAAESAAKLLGQPGAFLSGGLVHPDRGDRAREDRCELAGEVLCGIPVGDRRAHVDGAVLLAGTGDAGDLCHREVGLFHAVEEHVHGGDPHAGIGLADALVVVREVSARRIVFRQIFLEVDREGADDFAGDGVDDFGLEALRAGV